MPPPPLLWARVQKWGQVSPVWPPGHTAGQSSGPVCSPGHSLLTVCIYVCTCLYVYMCMPVCMYTRVCLLHTRVCLTVCIHVCLIVCIHVCASVYTHVYLIVCIHLCTYFYVYMCVPNCMYTCVYDRDREIVQLAPGQLGCSSRTHTARPVPDGPQPPDQYPAGPRPRPTWARWAHAPAALSPGCEDGRRCPSHRPVEAPPPATPPPPGGRGSWPGGSEGWVPPPLPGPVDPRFLTCQVRVMTEAPVGGGTPKLLGLAGWGREGVGSRRRACLCSGQVRIGWPGWQGCGGSLGES